MSDEFELSAVDVYAELESAHKQALGVLEQAIENAMASSAARARAERRVTALAKALDWARGRK